MSTRSFWLMASLLLVCGGCFGSQSTASSDDQKLPPPKDAPPPVAPKTPGKFRFSRMDSTGLEWTYRNGEEADQCTILESLGGGLGWFDFDRDGRLDLMLTGGGSMLDQRIQGAPSALYRQGSQWRFDSVGEFAGVSDSGNYSHGVALADYDNDGFTDILQTGYGGLRFWRNLGDGCFEDATDASGLNADTLWSSSAGWGDVNGDGRLDLYVAHYVDWSFENHPFCMGRTPEERDVCSPRKFQPLPDSLFLNQGDGRFEEARAPWRLAAGGKGLGVVLADLDNDFDIDVYVGNDTTDNFLYYNDGQALAENAALMGAAADDSGVANGSMGVDVLDFNRDGRTDIFVANFERESFALYRNEGDAGFLHASLPLGVTALGGLYVGFGSAANDWDLDGDEDVVVINGHVIKYSGRSPRRQTPVLLENDAGNRFRKAEFAADAFFSTPIEGRGLAPADLDHDGDLDMAVSLVNEPAVLLRNDTPHQGDWLQVTLKGRSANRDAVGARLELHLADGVLLRHVRGGGSYLSQGELTASWGVPHGAEIQSLKVYWPSGETQTLDPQALRLNQRWTVRQGRAPVQAL